MYPHPDDPCYKSKIKFIEEGPTECPECGGDGEVHYSCCGDDVKDTEAEDYDLCPTCKEHLPGREKCETCGGSGEISE